MKTLWPFNVHTSTRSAQNFTKYLSQDETYQGAEIDPHVCFYFSSIWGHSWAHTELWEHPPPPDTGTPPLTKSPGFGQRARWWGEWCEWKASRQGIFSDQFSNKSGNWSRIWFNAVSWIFSGNGNNSCTALQTNCIQHFDLWLIHFLTSVSITQSVQVADTGIIVIISMHIYLEHDSLA